MSLTKQLKQQILDHAKKESPRESCGLIVIVKGRRKYFKCKNIADSPTEHFIISPDDYARAEDLGSVAAVVHSHPFTDPRPSPADQAACNASGLPWIIVNPCLETWDGTMPGRYELPYVGREFVFGMVDCYSLIMDWYKKELKIKLDNFFRRDLFWERGENLYVDNYKSQGFRIVEKDDIRYADLIIMQLQSNIPNHGAIYIGDQQILHHVQGRLSSRDVYGGYYAKVTAMVLRHESR